MAEKPSTFAFCAACTIGIGDPMLGVIFTHTGSVVASLTQEITCSTRCASSPSAIPICLSGNPCGQERLSSNPSTPVASILLASCCQSFLLRLAAIEAITGRSE